MAPELRLVLDASTKTISLGVYRAGDTTWRAFTEASGDALETIFDLTTRVLREAETSLPQLSGIDFCAGPGSVLGLRLAAMAVQTWQCLPAHRHWSLRQYHSLTLASAVRKEAGEGVFTVLSPFRRDRFNAFVVDSRLDDDTPLKLVEREELEVLPTPCYWIPNGAVRVGVPDICVPLEYELEAFPRLAAPNPEWLRQVNAPEVYVPEAPVFVLWSAERHRKKEVE